MTHFALRMGLGYYALRGILGPKHFFTLIVILTNSSALDRPVVELLISTDIPAIHEPIWGYLLF